MQIGMYICMLNYYWWHAERWYADRQYADWWYADRRYADCRQPLFAMTTFFAHERLEIVES
jgi:hypothetical protein